MNEPFYQDNHNTIHCLDFRKNELPDECVQCVVTSPPYWGLRKYAGDQDLIWGDNGCEHQWGEETIKHDALRHRPGEKCIVGSEKNPAIRPGSKVSSGFCSLCGCWRGQLGLEPTMELYIQHLIEIMGEIKRVLRKDGVFFLNIGDSYAGSGSPGGDFRNGKGGDEYLRPYNRKGGILKPKDMCLIPFHIAIEAQRDGWWVRSVIIWEKKNPMPESCTDRPTESHEYILMLTKSGTTKYWTHRDGPGTREKPKADYRWVNQLTQEEVSIEPSDWKVKIKCPECDGTGYVDIDALWSISDKCSTCNGKKETQLWKRINLWRGHDYYWDADAVREPAWQTGTTPLGYSYDRKKREGERPGWIAKYVATTRNIRTVWEFSTTPFPSFKIDGEEIDHFAVFPEKLPELCIKAATPEVGCCSKCGAPWARVVKVDRPNDYDPNVVDERYAKEAHKASGYDGTNRPLSKIYKDTLGSIKETIGWQPTCTCQADKVPSLVLDPMMGAGTTLLVAKKLNRRAVGHELSREYCQLAVERCRQQVLL